MMVTFVSQCEKKALNKTRRVLDAFANRIGSRTWQTVITQEGLRAVKKLLGKTATKNTAVSCHWIRSRSRSELLWVVGSKRKFNHEGFVPVNSTQRPLTAMIDQTDWQDLPLIKALAALAALFHDWGKASEFFQYKLRQSKMIGDPYRHEWISLLFLSALCRDKTDELWLEQLQQDEAIFVEVIDKVDNSIKRPFKNLPPAALLVAWLVVSHHRLPVKKESGVDAPADWERMLRKIQVSWQYKNALAEDIEQLRRCFHYPDGLPSDAKAWLKEVKKWANKLSQALPLVQPALQDGTWRVILHYCRLSLMLGDHYYSSLEPNNPKRLKNRELKLYANTDKKHKPKQTLDEHLLGVAKQAVKTAHFLPVFEGRLLNGKEVLQRAEDIQSLKKTSTDKNFRWQDKAVLEISRWRTDHKLNGEEQFGFFTVNMASTGKGKTFANAKIMRALSNDANSLRYILALGLRTLTLQTGDEYRDRIGLDKDELAVLIGSRAVQELHNQKTDDKSDDKEDSYGGSESSESLMDNEIDFEVIPNIEEMLKTVLQRPKDQQFLYAPVLACTIDHMMAATETIRGGRYILPALRLMYSDLVIDEIDDFDGTDLVAIGRLIHLAGMLGRKVMISSATIPPDLAEGYFNSYQSGWALFARMRGESTKIGCAWIDEFKTRVDSISATFDTEATNSYQAFHQQFIEHRLKRLAEQPAKHKGKIVDLQADDETNEQTLQKKYFQTIQNAVIEQHHQHAYQDEVTGRHVSFGVVRIANITPCIELTRYLLSADWPENIEIRSMAYHSQQVLLMRDAQEKHLDAVLKRKKGKQASLEYPVIRKHIDNSTAKDLIFILVATPVEEVGRDHDFDWAVIEPSSFRSIIQMAGRVLRHQILKSDIDTANIHILQTNYKGFINKKIAFIRPGYESSALSLKTHDLKQLIDTQAIAKRLDASPRIHRLKELQPNKKLADLEHEAIHQLLTHYQERTARDLQGWLTDNWWLTGIPQTLVRFRQSNEQQLLYLVPMDKGMKFCEKDKGLPLPVERQLGIQHQEDLTEIQINRLWLKRDYQELLEQMGIDIMQAALIYGELNLPIYSNNNTAEYVYLSQLGLMRKSRTGE